MRQRLFVSAVFVLLTRGVLCPMDEGRFSAIEEITEGGRRAEAE